MIILTQCKEILSRATMGFLRRNFSAQHCEVRSFNTYNDCLYYRWFIAVLFIITCAGDVECDIMMDTIASPVAVVSPSSTISPLLGGRPLEERFEELAGNMFQRCRRNTHREDSATIGVDDEEEFDSPSYPIAEQQQKRKLEQQLSAGGG